MLSLEPVGGFGQAAGGAFSETPGEVSALKWTQMDLPSIAADLWRAAWRRRPRRETSQLCLTVVVRCHLLTPDRSVTGQ